MSLLLLSAGMAFAQRPGSFADDDFGQRTLRGRGQGFEGGYESFQRDRTVHRVLRLNRNGSAELLTEFRRKNDDNPREGWIRMDRDDVKKFGRIAAEAARGRTMRQNGRWTSRDNRVTIRFDDRLRLDDSTDFGNGRDRMRSDIELVERDGALWFDRDSDLYGNDRITFRPDRNGDGPSRDPAGLGYILYDRDYLRIEGIDLREGGDARLTVRAEGRRYEFRGDSRRRGDEVTFRIPNTGRDGGEFRLRMRGSQVLDIRGSGAYDRHRIDFDKEGRRRD